MPAFAGLDPADLDGLVTWVLSFRGDEPIEPTPGTDAATGGPPDAPGPPPDLEGRAQLGRRAWGARGCAVCHGARGDGRGVAAAALYDARGAPADLYDLRTSPLKGGDAPADLFRTLTRGRPGTPMPAFAELPPDERWALVAAIRAWRATALGVGAPAPSLRLPPPSADATPVPDRLWPARPLPPATLADGGRPPALAALDAESCARCHPAQFASWSTSRHALATGPGLLAQYHGADPKWVGGCDACHAPLAEQAGGAALHAEGVTCAVCHVRGHDKLGPPAPVVSRLPAHGARARSEPRLARSDACMPCHNLPLSSAVVGRPLIDTWREWAQSPYLPAGVQCQHCHQPDADHGFRGAHDRDAVRRGVRLEVDATGSRDRLRVTAAVRNVAVGHMFPTTATPRVVLRIRQLDRDGGPIVGTEASWAIGRTVRWVEGGWDEVADTRIAPGAESVRTWSGRAAAGAAAVEAALFMFPDWFYAGFYRGRLARDDLRPEARAAYGEALAEAESSGFEVRTVRRRLP
jgi:mono/diheme cytochrome c family protein